MTEEQEAIREEYDALKDRRNQLHEQLADNHAALVELQRRCRHPDAIEMPLKHIARVPGIMTCPDCGWHE